MLIHATNAMCDAAGVPWWGFELKHARPLGFVPCSCGFGQVLAVLLWGKSRCTASPNHADQELHKGPCHPACIDTV